MQADTLAYESGMPGALEPGETLVWEGKPQPPPLRRLVRRMLEVALVALLIGAALAVASGWSPGSAVLIGGLMAAPVIIGVAALSLRNHFTARKRAGETVGRVTDRRIMLVHTRRPPGTSWRYYREALAVRLVYQRDGLAELDVDGVGLTRDMEITTLPPLVIGHILQSGRRARYRRSRPMPRPIEEIAANRRTRWEMDDSLLAMLGLQPGETVLWEGRPQPRPPKDAQWMIGRLKIVAWALVPIGGILFCLSDWGRALAWGAYLFILIPSALWLYGAGSALLVTPFTQARRRRNTRYFLTTERAIAVIGKRGRTEVSSIFLDMAGSVTVEERPDGTGTVLVNGAQFEDVPEARAVHQQVVAAVRAAGGFEREVVPDLEED